jgi:phosphoglycolate phosphatase
VGDLHGRLIAFDLDGTLVDSRRDLADSANALIRELGGGTQPEEAIGRMVGEGAALLVTRALRASGLGVEAVPGRLERHLARFLQIYDGRLLNHTRPYDGVREAVAAARRHARVSVLTNKPSRATEAVLEGLGLRGLFDDVVGGDGAWPRKPDPASLRELMSRAAAGPPRTLLVGDSIVDYETAANAGARCCLAAYGFGFAGFPKERLDGGEWVVQSARELPPLFERFSAAR